MSSIHYNFYSPNEKINKKLQELNLPVTDNPDEKNTIICYPNREEACWGSFKTYPYDLSKYALLFKNNKIEQLKCFKRYGVPHPYSLIVKFSRVNKTEIKYPFVLKRSTGGCGSNVFLIDNYEDLERLEKKIPQNEEVIIQEVVDKNNRDIRVVVNGGVAICAYYRINEKEFRTNIARGAKAEVCNNEEVLSFAQQITDLFGIQRGAWDIFYNKEKDILMVNEFNYTFGKKGIKELFPEKYYELKHSVYRLARKFRNVI